MFRPGSEKLEVFCGIDQLDTVDRYLRHQRIGLLTTPTGMDKKYKATIDRLNEHYHLRALFAPEHGIRGDQQAGEMIEHQRDKRTGLPVYSLYGSHKAPTSQQLADLDVFVIDLQDVGARFYTYVYSMYYAMESCARAGIPVIVLDRPNPIGGLTTEGPLLQASFRSFVGLFPIPVRYGLTIGEFARYMNQTQQLNCALHVAHLAGWKRSACYDDTDLPWIAPSPNIPVIDSALAYIGTCLFEGTNVSEGRGTTKPFEIAGAPWLNHDKVLAAINQDMLAGCRLRPCWYQPVYSKYKNEICAGFQIHITDRSAFRPFSAGVALLDAIRQTHNNFSFREPEKSGEPWFIDLLSGDNQIRQPDFSLTAYLEKAREQAGLFKRESSRYWLYSE